VKICDFGLSCVKNRDSRLAGIAGSPFWMAPEIISGHLYDEKADVYSFGICVFEIFTSEIPFSEFVTDADSLKTVLNAVASGKRAALPDYVPKVTSQKLWWCNKGFQDMQNVIRACWAADASRRPPFDLLVKVWQLAALRVALNFVTDTAKNRRGQRLTASEGRREWKALPALEHTLRDHNASLGILLYVDRIQ